MDLPNQFIATRVDGKKKIPIDPRTGAAINPHDPANWLSEEAARAASRSIGFVLQEADPYVFLDFDNCRDEAGQWTPEASRIAGAFTARGAACEVSWSGNGLHVLCMADQRQIANLRNKIDGWKEIYWKERFVQFGPDGWRGDPNVDCTDLILAEYPERDRPDQMGIPETGPVPEWSGLTDDTMLIQQAMQAKPSANVAFGNKAPFKALWTGDREVLARFYPSSDPDKPWDASSAEAALAAHLAFWTGKDVARIERLIRASKVRHTPDQKKYERASYIIPTIRDAARLVQRVYQAPEKALPPPGTATGAAEGLPGALGVDALGKGLPDAPEVTGEYMTVFDQADHFAGCIYLADRHQVLLPSGHMVDPQVFKVKYGGHEFQMQADGARPTRDAFECFTQSRCVRFPQVDGVRYDVKKPFGDITNNRVNVLKLPDVEMSNEDPGPYLDLLTRLMPIERDRQIFLSWCAAAVQHRGVKFQWAIVLQGVEGNGKTFLLKCLEYAIGKDVTHLPNPEDMHEKYNDYIEGMLLIGVEEVHMAGRRELLDRLKKYITGDRLEIRAMRENKRMVDNLTNWFFLTNYKDAVLKQRNDRRFAPFFLAQQEMEDLARDGMVGQFFPRLWDWARGGGFAAVAGFLNRYDIVAEFNPVSMAFRAPETSSSGAAIAASRGVLEECIQDAIDEERVGFRGGWISSFHLEKLIRDNFRKKFSTRIISDALRNLDYELCDLWRDGRTKKIFQEENRRIRLYWSQEMKQKPPHEKNIEGYLLSQGYVDPPGLQLIVDRDRQDDR